VNPHPRIRKTVKWGGAAASAVYLAGWALSVFWPFGGTWDQRHYVGAHCGAYYVMIVEPGGPPAFDVFWIDTSRGVGLDRLCWWFGTEPGNLFRHYLVPAWSLVALAAVATAIGWHADARADRARRDNLCSKCQYDLSGLAPGAVCPECGAAATTSPAAAS
jgi:hypothetical protein